MGEPSPSPEELRAKISQLEQLVESLTNRITELVNENTALREQLTQSQKEAARQAASFRRQDTHKIPPDQHKKSGRPLGHQGVNRPIPDHIDQVITVPLDGCPHCQGSLRDCQSHTQYIEEIPPVRPLVTKLTTHSGVCPQCGPVRSTHPLQAGRGFAASRVQLGPRALAVAASLNKHHGLSMRKTCRVLSDVCGLKLSAGGLSQALDRVATRLEADYQQLFVDVRAGPAVYVDETSWWVGGSGWWLWAFTSPTTTLYQVRAERASSVVIDVLGQDYPGVLVSDCLNIYDSGVPYTRKHKCIAHHQKAIREQLDSVGLGEHAYLESWKEMFRGVCEVCRVWPKLSQEQQLWVRDYFVLRRDELLAGEVNHPADARIRNRLEKQREYLLTCLEKGECEATNNRAERALRPAVITRKVSCGNKTDRGKSTWERIASVATTLVQRGRNLLNELAKRCSIHTDATNG